MLGTEQRNAKRFVLVTGASGGFGQLICLELLQAGFGVIATMRDYTQKHALMQEANKLGIGHLLNVLPLDITKDEDITKVKEIVESAYGKIDVLINNAGYCQGGFFTDISLEKLEAQFATNVFGTYRMIQAFLPLLEKSTQAQIINMGSVSGSIGFPGLSAYASSKSALAGLSESLRLELKPKGIRVSLVEPSSFQTNIWQKSLVGIQVDHDNALEKGVLTYAQKKQHGGGNPLDVAELVTEICETKRPRFRYAIGKGSVSFVLWKNLLPWFVVEFAMLTYLKFTGNNRLFIHWKKFTKKRRFLKSLMNK